MPKMELEKEAAADLRQSAEQKRADTLNVVKGATNQSTMERQALQAKHDDLLRNKEAANDPRIATVLSGQRSQLDQVQKARLDLLNMALAAGSRLANSGNGARQDARILDQAKELGNSLSQNNRQLLSEIDLMKNLLADNNAQQRSRQIDTLVQQQKENANLLDRDIRAAKSAIERTETLAKNVLDGNALDRLRTAVTEASKSDKVRGLFSNDVLQRLADEALVPGRDRLRDDIANDAKSKEAAVQRVKGELAEAIAKAKIVDDIKRENLLRSEENRLHFIDGNRIRDDMGKLGDGLIVWRDQEQKLRVWAMIEVKSGKASATGLHREKMDEADRAEREKYLRGIGENSKLIESGQLNASEERMRMALLDPGGRLYVDGGATDVQLDRERAKQKDFVRGYVVDDAIKSKDDVNRLGVNAKDLDDVARALVEELLRKRDSA
ncbi:MAG TPA: hypothetical protein VMU26_19830 [Candidatus Polarisedimenticolia bacterium]|nr:hypothetical protein [Candidatus Polarisedimenticolia bacterium]